MSESRCCHEGIRGEDELRCDVCIPLTDSDLLNAAKDVLVVFAADVPGSRALSNLHSVVYGDVPNV